MKKLRTLSLLLVVGSGCGGPNATVDPLGIAKNDTGKKGAETASENKPTAAKETFEIRPENFEDVVTNPYFSIVPGRKFYFDGQSPEGIKIHKELLASDRTKEFLGVTTHGVWEREWHDDSLVSDKKKWYAQDKDDNVWIFGEDAQRIFGGYLTGPGDSWAAGVAEAKAGIVVPGDAKLGVAIEREFNGYSKQKGEVLGISEDITVKKGAMNDCLKIRDIEISKSKEEHSYYCKESGHLSLELVPNSLGKIELTKIEDNVSTAGMNIAYPPLKVSVSDEKAREIALEKVDGATTVKSLSLGLWDHKPAYVAEVQDAEDKTVLVYINIESGLVLETVK